MNDDSLDLVKCPRCGKPSPEDFLSCIYCGSRLDVRAGFITSLGPPKKFGLILLVALIVILFLMWAVF